ncbi:MAG: heme exporter protein CcmB [Candidatus Methylomirabilis sp.]|nr:heme exporter protein CcmB [Candidatus Methylomirabilis sp.]
MTASTACCCIRPSGRPSSWGSCAAASSSSCWSSSISFPVFAVLYNMDIWSQLPKLLLIAVPATFGFATAGTLLSTMTVGLRAREAMLPFLLFPLTIPLILAAVRGTEIVLRGEVFELAMPWLKLTGAFDVLFLVGSLLTFELLIEE